MIINSMLRISMYKDVSREVKELIIGSISEELVLTSWHGQKLEIGTPSGIKNQARN